MKGFRQWLEADYCSGVSLNVDMFWNPDKDVSWLTTGKSQMLAQQLQRAAISGKMKVFDNRLTQYGDDPSYGFSYLVVLGQSHIMVHTWPEKHMMNLDVFTCGNEGDPKHIVDYLKQSLRPDHVQVKQAARGVRKDIHSTQEPPDGPQDINKQQANKLNQQQSRQLALF